MKCPKHKVGDREPPLEGPRLERSPGAGTPAPGGPGGGGSAWVGPGPLIQPARAGGGASPGRGGAGRGDWPTGKAAGGASLWRSGRGRGRGAGLEELTARQVPRSQQLAARLFPAEAAIVIHPRPEEPPDPARPPARRRRRRRGEEPPAQPPRLRAASGAGPEPILDPEPGSWIWPPRAETSGPRSGRKQVLDPSAPGTGRHRAFSPPPPGQAWRGGARGAARLLGTPRLRRGWEAFSLGIRFSPWKFQDDVAHILRGSVVARSWAPWEWGGVRRGRGWLPSRTCLLERGWGRGGGGAEACPAQEGPEAVRPSFPALAKTFVRVGRAGGLGPVLRGCGLPGRGPDWLPLASARLPSSPPRPRSPAWERKTKSRDQSAPPADA